MAPGGPLNGLDQLVYACELDATWRITGATAAWRSLGWDPAALVGRDLLSLVHPEDAAGVQPCTDALIARFGLGDGPWAWLEWRFVSDGSGFTGVAVDRSTEYGLMEAHQELRRLMNVEQQNRALDACNAELAHTYAVARRFVPDDFLRHLGVDSFSDVQLGDQVEDRMTIMFCDIRRFTPLMERLTPSEGLQFINEYLAEVGPVVRENGGFIDEYLGDGIKAVFPTPLAAVDAAVGLQRAVDRFNERRADRWDRVVEVGLGIHTGRVMLGIVGEPQRWNGTVIADAVNVSARIEQTTKHYGARALISDVTRDELGDSAPATRLLDQVMLKGKSEPTRIYEVIAADPAPLRQIKEQSLDRFAAATDAWCTGRIDEALRIMAGIVSDHPDDRPAAQVLARWRTEFAAG